MPSSLFASSASTAAQATASVSRAGADQHRDEQFIRIGKGTEIAALENELRWNDAAYRLRG